MSKRKFFLLILAVMALWVIFATAETEDNAKIADALQEAEISQPVQLSQWGDTAVCFAEMNHVLRIDRKERYARVEAGVTLGELIPLMRERGLRLNIPFLARPNKSAVATATS